MSVAVKIPPVARMTVTEFLAWPGDPSKRRYQLVEGEPVAMAPAARRHGAIQAELGALLRNHLRERGSPCIVITEPGISPRIRTEWNVRIPDLAVTCGPDDGQHLVADPVLVVELLSPSNEAETWANVWTYSTVPTVREMLVVSTIEIRAWLLRRSDDGSWPERFEEILGHSGQVALRSIDAVFDLRAFYATTSLT
jgi:Uma2 family endonuclease